MKFLIIQLALIGNEYDKKERLLILPQQTSGSDINITPEAKNYLTISNAEYQNHINDWETYRANLISLKISELTPA